MCLMYVQFFRLQNIRNYWKMNSQKYEHKLQNNNQPPSANTPDSKKIQNYIYKFADQIGKGNFSKVYKGIHELTHQQVAIKTIELHSLETPRLKQLLNTETVVLKMLNHPNIIKCYQILSSLRNCYIITELCNGGDLETKLKKQGSIQEKDLYEIVINIYEGLKYLCSKNIVHRDIKLSNIFIHNGAYKIADFGFAQISQKQFKDVSVGSPIYMSPEGFIQNIYSSKTDIWAFGVLLYELVEGHTPCYQSRSEEELKQNLQKPLEKSDFTSGVSDSYKELVISCMNIDYKKRISVEEMQNLEWIKKARESIRVNRDRFMSEDVRTSFERKSNNYSDIKLQKKDITSISNKFSEFMVKKQSMKYRGFLSEEGEKTSFRQDSLLKNSYNNSFFENAAKDKEKPGLKRDQNIFYSPKNIPNTLKQCIKRMEKNPSGGYLKHEETSKNDNFLSTQESFLNRKEPSIKEINHEKKFVSYEEDRNSKDFLDKKTEQTNRRASAQCTGPDKKNNSVIPSYNSYRPKQRNLAHQSQIFKPVDNNILQPYKKYFHECREDRKSVKHENLSKLQKNKIQKVARLTEQPSGLIERKTLQQYKIFKRDIKFRDCIGLIHYCRLSFKLACLLGKSSKQQEAREVFTNWCVVILEQLHNKIMSNDIIYGNQAPLMENPSLTQNDPDRQKKRKLKDVTEEYLRKYKDMKTQKKKELTIKQVCNFTYQFYLMKAQQQKSRGQKQDCSYLAQICYTSLLDKQTRALMQFTRQIKSNFDGKNIEKLLAIKIHNFSSKEVDQMFKQTY